MPNLFTLKDHLQESQLYFSRAVLATGITCFFLLVLISRLVYLQIIQHSLYKTLSLHNQIRIVPLVPTRGLIFDRHGTVLAENISAFSLEITPERTLHMEATLKAINSIMPITEEEERQFYKQLKYKRRNEGIPIRIKLTEQEVAKFAVEKYRLPGVDIAARLIRHYPLNETLAHVLGYIGPLNEKDLADIDPSNYRGSYYIGKTGLEKFYENSLHGKVGYQQIETDAKGRTVRFLNRVPPNSGANLHLTIDLHLQKACYQALKDLKGAIVAIDPKNGDVLALASNPAFDPNLFTQGIDTATYQNLKNSADKPLFNRAIQGQYPPGSTIKPLVALQGLETGTIDPNFHLFDPGWYQLTTNGRLYRDMLYSATGHGHGWVNLEKAISRSCDTYFFSLAHKLGIRHLYTIYTRFGLGKATNIDTMGEAAGLTPSVEWKKKIYKEDWYAGDTLNVGIGQGTLLATPLQMAQVATILANKGKYFKPRLVASIHFTHTNTHIEQPCQTMPEVALNQARNWDVVINAMKKVVHMPGGTAYRISHGLKYQIAGKTGTAQVFSLKENEKYDVNKVKSHLRDHSWFIAFAPADQPKIALAVLIENKQTKTGADIARVILDNYLYHTPVSNALKQVESPPTNPQEEELE